MTDKLAEEFNLLPPDNIDTSDQHIAEVMEEATEIVSSLSAAEKIDAALTVVTGFDEHDSEMDNIAQKALTSYEDLINIGMNCTDAHAGKIFEVAATMLKTAMDSKDAKINKKLKMVDLQLKKAKIDGTKGPIADGVGLDRNAVISMIRDGITDQNSSESDK